MHVSFLQVAKRNTYSSIFVKKENLLNLPYDNHGCKSRMLNLQTEGIFVQSLILLGVVANIPVG